MNQRFIGQTLFKLLFVALTMVFTAACDAPGVTSEEPGVTGNLVYQRSVKGGGLADRDVVVWLPPGYEENSDEHYPVLYMHDGQNLFDPATSYAGVDWSIDEAMDRLIRSGRVAPMIVVGVYNSADRTAEYSPGEMGTTYMAFIIDVVKPMIDQAYRTRPERQHTLVGGASSGGTISFMLAWDHPEIFSGAICMSPAFKVGPGQDFSPFDFIGYFEKTRALPRDVFFYIDNGGVGLDEILQPGIEDMLGSLERWGYRASEDWVFNRDPNAKHDEAAWAMRFPDALIRTLHGVAANQP